MDFPRDCWYVAATSTEVGRRPIGRRLLGTDVVLWRRQDGDPVALGGLCAHRGYPLAEGHVEDDAIVCGYHGERYDASGACVEVPSQPHPPYGAGVAAYEVREEPPFVWIWLGQAQRAALRSLPRLPWLTGEGWTSSGTTLTVHANFMLVHEHYLDLSHIPHVHPDETPPGLDAVPPLDEISVSETSATYARALPPAPLADWEAEATGLPRDREYERRHDGRFLSPAVLAEGWEILGPDGAAYGQVRVQAVTPESDGTTHLFWRFARSYGLDDERVGAHLHRVFEGVMRVDVDVIERLQAARGSDFDGFHVAADAGVIKVRRIVADMVAREATRGRADGRVVQGAVA